MSERIALGKTEGDGNLYLDVQTLVDTRALITGNSGAGKSRLLRRIAEQAFGRVQIIIIDPEGEFPTLREKHAFLLAGRGGEVPAEPRAAALLARRLMELRVSAVVDLYDLRLPQQREFVRIFLDALMTLDKRLYRPTLVMIDEAHKFAPERTAGEAESTDAVIALMSQGRKRGLCGIPATQRLSKLHKDAAAEGNNVFVGRTVLDVDQKRAGDALGLSTQADRLALRDLENGTFLAFGPALDAKGVVTFRGAEIHTTHPKAGQRHKAAETAPPDAIKKLSAELKDLPEQAAEEIRTLQAAQARVRELERELRAATKAAPATKEDPAVRRRDAAQIRALSQALEAAMKFIVTISAEGFFKAAGDKVDPAEIRKALDAALQNVTRVVERRLDARNQELDALRRDAARVLARLQTVMKAVATEDVHVNLEVKHQEPFSVAPARPPRAAPRAPSNGSGNGALPKSERAILIAIAQRHPRPSSRGQISILSGYSIRSSSFQNALSALRTAGYIAGGGEAIGITEAGLSAAGDYPAMPSPEERHAWWGGKLAKAERALLDVLVAEYPETVSREGLSERSGYSITSSSFQNALSTLRTLELVEGRGDLVASRDLFE